MYETENCLTLGLYYRLYEIYSTKRHVNNLFARFSVPCGKSLKMTTPGRNMTSSMAVSSKKITKTVLYIRTMLG